MPTAALLPTPPETDPARPRAAVAVSERRFSLQIHPTRADWHEVEGWMTAHGWDPGYGDARAVIAVDPRALMIGHVDDVPVSAISVVQLGEAGVFIGSFFVRPQWRGLGYGTETWRAAWPHTSGRSVGLEATARMEPVYRRLGFTRSHETVTYHGPIRTAPRIPDPQVRPFEPEDLEQVAALDAQCTPFARTEFLAAWIAAGERTLVYTAGPLHAVQGIGTIRRSRTGLRVGPLIASTPMVARVLFDALTAPRAYRGEQVAIEAPSPNRFADALARDRGLEPGARTVRMYSTRVRPFAHNRYCFSLASLAYG